MTEMNSSTRHITVFLPITTSPQCEILIGLTFDRLVSLQKYQHTARKLFGIYYVEIFNTELCY